MRVDEPRLRGVLETCLADNRQAWELRADGSYESQFQGRTSNHTVRESDSGTIILDGGLIIIRSIKNPAVRNQFVAFMEQPDGAAILTLLFIGDNATVARVVGDAQEIYDQRIPVDDALRRIESLYKPYHRALRRFLRRLVVRARHPEPEAPSGHGRGSPGELRVQIERLGEALVGLRLLRTRLVLPRLELLQANALERGFLDESVTASGRAQRRLRTVLAGMPSPCAISR